jgi:hypothetical protein
VKTNLLTLALVLGFHLGPAWALLIIVLAVVIKIFPFAVALEIIGPAVISAINKRRHHYGL